MTKLWENQGLADKPEEERTQHCIDCLNGILEADRKLTEKAVSGARLQGQSELGQIQNAYVYLKQIIGKCRKMFD